VLVVVVSHQCRRARCGLDHLQQWCGCVRVWTPGGTSQLVALERQPSGASPTPASWPSHCSHHGIHRAEHCTQIQQTNQATAAHLLHLLGSPDEEIIVGVAVKHALSDPGVVVVAGGGDGNSRGSRGRSARSPPGLMLAASGCGAPPLSPSVARTHTRTHARTRAYPDRPGQHKTQGNNRATPQRTCRSGQLWPLPPQGRPPAASQRPGGCRRRRPAPRWRCLGCLLAQHSMK
jgi:hypothetical protein